MIQFPKINGRSQTLPGVFSMPPALRADTGDFAPWCLEAFCQRLNLTREEGASWLLLRRDESLPPEGYLLEVTEHQVNICASTERGVIWALTTLYLRREADGRVSCCRLQDAPQYPHRGQSMDPVRHFFAIEEIRKILEQMSLVKMNVLHFHLSDDQGWRMESRKFPALHGVNDQYYTQEQLRQLVEFARIRGIEILPEIDLPGHTTAVLAAYPHLGCTGEKPALAASGGIYTTILCAGKEEVYAFLEELLEEIFSIFPGERFHIGGDEAPKKQWTQCPACTEASRKLHGDFEQLQAQFTRRVADMLRKHGKTPVCWNEVLSGYPDAQDLQIQYWTMNDPEKMNAYAKNGGSYIYSYMCELYLDYPYSMTNVRRLHRMRPHIWTRSCGKDTGLLGLESTMWTEHISEPRDLQEHLLPRMYIVAEKAWAGSHLPYRAFLANLRKLCCLARMLGVSTMPQERWNPTGKPRRAEALEFFSRMNGGALEEVPENQSPAPLNLKLMADYVAKFFRISDLPALYKLYFH